MTAEKRAASAGLARNGSTEPLAGWMLVLASTLVGYALACSYIHMEPLTAITLLAAQYGIRQVVAALTGNQEMSALAGEMFRQLSASEDRLSSHLTHIEEQLDQVLEQPYKTAIGAGARGLLDVIATKDSRARRQDLMQARERFRDATAAAQSQLQRAVAERYLLLCAIALDRKGAAKTALAQLNCAATTAALEVVDTMLNANRLARSYLEDHGEGRGFGKDRRLTARAGEIRYGAGEAAQLVANLLSEAGVVGQTLGQTKPPTISTAPPVQSSTRFLYAFPRPMVTWQVVPNGPGPVRVGALVVTWEQREPSGAVQRMPTLGMTTSQRFIARAGGAPYIRDVQVHVKIEADPPLSRSVPLTLGWGNVRRPAASNPGPRSHTLPEYARLYHLKETVITSAYADGKIAETPNILISSFQVY